MMMSLEGLEGVAREAQHDERGRDGREDQERVEQLLLALRQVDLDPSGSGLHRDGGLRVRGGSSASATHGRRLAQAHLAVDFVDGRLGPRGCSRSAPASRMPIDLCRVGHQLQVALPGGRIVPDDPIREQLLGVDAAGAGGALAVPHSS